MKKFFGLILALILALSLTTMAWGETVENCSGNCNHVAAIDTTHYDTIQAAVEAAVDGDTVIVIADHALDCSSDLIVIDDAGTEITIDLNGCVITADNTGGSAIAAIITVENEGKLTILDSSPEKTGGISVTTATSPNVSCIFYNNNSEQPNDNPDYSLIIESGMYTMNDSASAVVYSSQSNTTIVVGGSFVLDSVGTRSNGSPWIFNASGKSDARIIVSGGSFNDDIAHQYYMFEVYITPEKVLVQNGNMWTLQGSAAYVTERLYGGFDWDVYIVGYQTHEDAFASTKENAADDLISLTLNKDWPVSDTLIIDFDLCNRDDVSVAPVIGETGLVMNGKTILWSGDADAPIFTVKAGNKLVVNGVFTPKREGYDFLGWYTDAAYENEASSFGGEKSIIDNTGSTEDISLYAKWTVGTYTVTLNTDGGTIAAGKEVAEYTYGVGATLPAAADMTKSGYTFAGWYDNSDFTGTAVTEISATDTGNKTYYAKWTAIPTGGYYPVETPEDKPTETPEDKPAETKPVEKPVTPPTEEEVVTPTPEDTTPVVPDDPVIDEPVVDEPPVDDEPQQGSVAVWIAVGAVAVAAGAAAIIIGKKRSS